MIDHAMYEQSRRRRNPVRYLAPLALAVMAIATYFVVQHALDTSSGSNPASTTSTQTSTRVGSASAKKGGVKTKFYVVRSGDSLSVISARTGVPLPTLESLNPGVSSGALQVGQRLRLSR
jgi:LysM repeat protein